MYLVVYGLRNAGLTQYLADILTRGAEQGLWVATPATGLIAAFLSSIMNNMPTVLIGALSIDASQAGGVVREAMVYANVIEIGRASCRERVCRYVSISVVAVSLKKKSI